MVTNWVLKAPSKADQKLILGAMDDALTQMDVIVTGDFERAMQNLHSR